jgi:class 3 adenylate cyclase/tetratricopeptide (TPR) repeat protein
MKCPKCQTENLADSAFCEECGAPLEAACPACGTGNRPTAKFCRKCRTSLAPSDKLKATSQSPSAHLTTNNLARSPAAYTPKHLADKILTSRSALEGERKQVTVLFADVKGSMELAEQVDAEAWHQIMDRFFAILSDGVHRFEGTVNQYTGDGIMALFGAPIAHEDHAQRACFAALQLRDGLQEYARDLKRDQGMQFSTRIGINSGDVVVGKIGDDLRMDYTAQGHTVGLAARMESLASPDTIYLTKATADLCTGYFDLLDLGVFNVKGASEPIGVHQLKGVGPLRTRFDVSRARGLSRFVGRADEMEILERAFDHARKGQGQVVGVVAHAGVGKSRLCFEFLEIHRARGVFTNQGQAVPHGRNIPLLPMMQAFRAYYGITEQDEPRAVREKIAGRMLLMDESFREVLPLLFDFFGAPDPERPVPPMDPDARRRQLIGILRRTVQIGRREEGGITLLEDLHWFDEASEAFLREWVDAIQGANNLLILNFRPEYRADWMNATHYTQIALQPLGPEAIRELLDDLLGSDPSIAGLADTIHERTRGNPFFTEEVVRALIEDGQLVGTRGAYRLVTSLRNLQVPDSVHAVLAARIDRLAERQKQLLQTAAVIGKNFEEPILEAVANLPRRELADSLAALKSGEFVYEESLYPVVEYAFRHPLTQEVALNSQLGERRRRLHAAVAGAIEEQKADRLDEQAALLAHHWQQAGEPLQAARWAARAAGWAARSDPAEGVRLWQLVLGLARQVADSEEAVRLRMDACREILLGGAWRTGMRCEEIEALYEEGRQLGEARDDRHHLAALAVGYVPSVGLVFGDVSRYASAARRVLPLIEEAGDPELLAVSMITLGYSHVLIGRVQESLDYARRCLALGETDPALGRATVGFSAYLWGRMQVACAEAWSGDIQHSLRELQPVIRAAREAGEIEILGWAVCNLVEFLTLFAGELGEAPALAREGLGASERRGSPFSQVHSLARGVALVQLFQGDFQNAVASLERALAISRERRTSLEQEPYILALLAQAHLGAGSVAHATALAREALAMARQRGSRWGELQALGARARALLAADDAGCAAEIERLVEQMAALAEETGMRLYAPQAIELRADLAGLRGDLAARDSHRREAQRLYAEMGATGHAARLAKELNQS